MKSIKQVQLAAKRELLLKMIEDLEEQVADIDLELEDLEEVTDDVEDWDEEEDDEPIEFKSYNAKGNWGDSDVTLLRGEWYTSAYFKGEKVRRPRINCTSFDSALTEAIDLVQQVTGNELQTTDYIQEY
jgi:hypothetical protein